MIKGKRMNKDDLIFGSWLDFCKHLRGILWYVITAGAISSVYSIFMFAVSIAQVP
jgi:hypothetical protein